MRTVCIVYIYIEGANEYICVCVFDSFGSCSLSLSLHWKDAVVDHFHLIHIHLFSSISVTCGYIGRGERERGGAYMSYFYR